MKNNFEENFEEIVIVVNKKVSKEEMERTEDFLRLSFFNQVAFVGQMTTETKISWINLRKKYKNKCWIDRTGNINFETVNNFKQYEKHNKKFTRNIS